MLHVPHISGLRQFLVMTLLFHVWVKLLLQRFYRTYVDRYRQRFVRRCCGRNLTSSRHNFMTSFLVFAYFRCKHMAHYCHTLDLDPALPLSVLAPSTRWTFQCFASHFLPSGCLHHLDVSRFSSSGVSRRQLESNASQELALAYRTKDPVSPGSASFVAIRVNQDELSSIDRCLKVAKERLEQGESVVIDATNKNVSTIRPNVLRRQCCSLRLKILQFKSWMSRKASRLKYLARDKRPNVVQHSTVLCSVVHSVQYGVVYS